jgi:hypothetical protein
MRSMSLLFMTAAVAACSTAPPPASRMADAQAELQRLTAGRVAGPAMNCLPGYRSRTAQMVVIDNNTVAFRNPGGPVYINHLKAGSCSGLNSGFYSLVTKSHGALGLCSGDQAQVVDTANGVTVGTCVLGEFTPYSRS